MNLSAKLYSFTGSFLKVVQGGVILNVGQQSLNILFKHRESAFAELKGSIMLFQLGKDGTILKFKLDQDPSHFEENFLLGRICHDTL